jgi:ubiquinone/menaquinone biosynthesis C-methylase UbiE
VNDSGPSPGYTIQGGEQDAPRLARQARVMAQASAAFVRRVGLGSGWRCLDVGCGDGQMTIAFARAVGQSGRAVGLDIDATALDIARAAAARAAVSATFVLASASAVVEPEAFDLAYARLLLSHLADPMAALRSMHADLRAGGAVAIEDLFTGTLRSDPPTAALDRLQDIYAATVRFHGGDPTIGPRLPALLDAAGFTDIHQATVTNTMTTADDKLFLSELLDNMRPAILEAGAATAAELEQVREAVEAAARDPKTVFYQARIHQVWGRRP